MVDRAGRGAAPLSARALARRLARAAATLAVVFAITFLLLHLAAADPAERLDDPGIPAEQAARTRAALGLDRPLGAQFLATLGAWSRGELGVSIQHRRPVREVLAEALPGSLLLGAAALLVAYSLGPLVATGCALLPPRGQRRADALLLAAATLPRFWLGVMLVLVFHTWAGLLPASHAAAPGAAARFDFAHLVLPALALALPAAAAIARVQRAAMDDPEVEPRLALARAAGVSAPRALWRHRVRPALAPVAALAALDLPLLVSGAVVVESVFAWPGAGRVAADAVMGGDYPLALAATMLAAATVVAGGVLLDAALPRLDPRAREGA